MSNGRRILILGASGMLGSATLRYLSTCAELDVTGTVRSQTALRLLPGGLQHKVLHCPDMTNLDNLVQLFEQARPEVVINCVGLVKQLSAAADPVAALMVNAIMPHRLARLCGLTRARLIHISTDCVFSGQRGMYTEEDRPDAYDLYGRSKLLGEVSEGNVLTLRTSIIGPELDSNHGLFSWFLAQRGVVSGFRRAIFSGLPTVVLAQVIHEYVLAHEDLRGLYHVSAAPISKYELLELISRTYSLATRIEPKDEPVIDRSLDSHRFRQATGYDPLPWPQLIEAMKRFN